jgi:hypothetical protein
VRRRVTRAARRPKAEDDDLPDMIFDKSEVDDFDVDIEAPLVPAEMDLDFQDEGEIGADAIS